MKRISFLWLILALCASAPLRAQDAATEERLNKLNGRIDDLRDSQEPLKNKIEALSREIAGLRDQASKPSPNYAAQEDLVRLKHAIEEVDRKRQEDYAKIHAELDKLITSVNSAIRSGSRVSSAKPSGGTATPPENPDQKVFEYVIQKGDSLSLIVAAYREKNIKVTTDQILKANPGLKPGSLKVGQKIFIPAPQ
jgi:LysM repeat protein